MTRSRAKTGYLPSLDGWRAVAITGVLITHDPPWHVGPFSNDALRSVGGYGVELFFAISGILICTRILEEEALLGRFDLKAFYIRRLLRIQPAALVYLACIAFLMLTGVVHESWHYWRGAFFFYANYLWSALDRSGTGAFTGHFWTLSVEEHFYILLSLLLFCFRRNRIVVFACTMAVILAAHKILHRLGYFSETTSTRKTLWVVQFLLVPAYMALLLRVARIRSLADRFLLPWVAFAITFGTMFLARLLPHRADPFWSMNLFAAQSKWLFYGFAFWVIATMLHPASLSTRILELRPLKYVGRLSYSLYLWHVLFFVPAFPEVGITARPLLFLSERPWKYMAAFAAAMLSYYFIEKPLIRLGHRLAPPATPGHSDLAAGTSPERQPTGGIPLRAG